MERRTIDAPNAPVAAGGYAQAIEVTNPVRWLFISGQIPVGAEGETPTAFHDQALLAWRNLEAQLHAAGMSLDHLVKVTIFLADRAHALANREARQAVLGERKVAMSVIICGIFDAGWLIEIEAVAAA